MMVRTDARIVSSIYTYIYFLSLSRSAQHMHTRTDALKTQICVLNILCVDDHEEEELATKQT